VRGQKVAVGSTRVAPNGYHYTKVKEGGREFWKLTHHIVAEKALGRKLREDERVSFKKGKTNLSWDNLVVAEKGTGSSRRRLAQIRTRIQELQAEEKAILAELEGGRIINHNRPNS
jgi:hypothetical protein